MDREDAIKATRQSAIAACVSAALTLALVGLAISTDSVGELAKTLPLS
jgi:hypothetical protein